MAMTPTLDTKCKQEDIDLGYKYEAKGSPMEWTDGQVVRTLLFSPTHQELCNFPDHIYHADTIKAAMAAAGYTRIEWTSPKESAPVKIFSAWKF